MSSAGLRILVGRSNRQNDRLTAKEADRRDIWLHTQKIHGSHVILCTGGQEPDEASLYEAGVPGRRTIPRAGRPGRCRWTTPRCGM